MLQTHLNTPQNGENIKNVTAHIAGTCLSNSLNDPSTWIIDSSASSHICHDKFMFTNHYSAQNMFVILSTKTHLKVEHIGYIFISNDLVLKDVLYIPDFKYNLLSISTLLKYDKFDISFADSNCLIQDKWLSKMIWEG